MEENRKFIQIADLRDIVNSILTHIETELEVQEVELTEDYYWDVSERSLYISKNLNAENYVGSLYDDLEFLIPLMQDKGRAVSLMLIHVAPLLRYLAHNVKE